MRALERTTTRKKADVKEREKNDRGWKKEVGEKLSVNLSTCMRTGTRVIVFRSLH